jgi:predicted proteasome-type protease
MAYCCGIQKPDGVLVIADRRVLEFVAEGFENPVIAGGLIECAPGAPYFQIRGHGCHKSILKQSVSLETDIYDALKIGVVSTHAAVPTPPGRGVHS